VIDSERSFSKYSTADSDNCLPKYCYLYRGVRAQDRPRRNSNVSESLATFAVFASGHCWGHFLTSVYSWVFQARYRMASSTMPEDWHITLTLLSRARKPSSVGSGPSLGPFWRRTFCPLPVANELEWRMGILYIEAYVSPVPSS
jgi:hypothetical protein